VRRFEEQSNGQRLHDLLIQPVQRIPRYNLLLQVTPSDPYYCVIHVVVVLVRGPEAAQELLKHTPEDHPDKTNLAAALESMKSVTQCISSPAAASMSMPFYMKSMLLHVLVAGAPKPTLPMEDLTPQSSTTA
jgi:hypothetical protein